MNPARLCLPAIRYPTDDLDPYLRLAERGVGGFCLFGPFEAKDVARLQAAALYPLLIASDLEDGLGQQRRDVLRHPPAAALDPAVAEAAGIRTAIDARPLGVTMTFAPVCDVLSEPSNPIIQGRAFRDPLVSAPRFVWGARRFGLRTCAKHFPGHGATTADSHDSLPRVDAGAKTWRARDLPPFKACIDAGVDAVMTAHVACPALTGSGTLPATLSRRVMTDLLRKEMGFRGLAVTDALSMEGVRSGRGEAEAAARALEAGCDALLCPDDVEGVLRVLGKGAPEASLARMAVAAEPLPEPIGRAAEASVRSGGDLPVGPGPHPLRAFDLDARGGATLSTPRLAVEAVAIYRSDRAWGGPLVLPGEVRAAAESAALVIACGPEVLLEGLEPPAWVHAPGRDPYTLAAVRRRAFA